MANLNNKQRAEMVMNGMNPLNENHVKSYLSGRGLTQAEVNARAQAMLGDIMSVPLGHSKEGDRDVVAGTDYVPRNAPAYEDPREVINNSMEDYGASSGNMSSAGLMSLNERAPRPQQLNENVNVQALQQNGTKLATDYYNAFIQSLKTPSYNSNLQVFNSLKALLEYENKVKKQHGDKARSVLNESVTNITRQMYQNIKGSN